MIECRIYVLCKELKQSSQIKNANLPGIFMSETFQAEFVCILDYYHYASAKIRLGVESGRSNAAQLRGGMIASQVSWIPSGFILYV